MNKLSLKEFADTIKNKISAKLSSCDISIQEVIKNNDTRKLGLVIKESGENIAPTIYLNDVYGDYCKGSIGIDTIADEIASQYKNLYSEDAKRINLLNFANFDEVRDRICYRLVNREANRALFEDKPYRNFLDLALYYYIDLSSDDEEHSASVAITFDMMRLWNTDERTLFYLARDNTRRICDYSVRNIMSVLYGVLPDDELLASDDEFGMYVVTSQTGSYGAAALMDESLCYSFAEKCGKDYFILPSSVHELLFVPDNNDIKVQELAAMVREINQTQVAVEERLSDSVYLYMKESGHILKAA